MDRIKIINSKQNNITIGERTQTFISGLKNKLNEEETNTLVEESAKILSKCIYSEKGVTGLAFGYVQSGKTMSFTALTTLAADNGIDVIVFLAGTKNNLLDQTKDRLYKDLKLNSRKNSKLYRIFSNPDQKDAVKILRQLSSKRKPTLLLPILKLSKRIDNLVGLFTGHEFIKIMKNRSVLIIDDEADQASLNTYARKNSKSEDWEEDKTSATYSSILKLKSSFSNHSYVQYTATPQGPVLINMMDLLSPKFHIVLTPGKTYTGGKTFFIDNPDLIITIPEKEVYHHKDNNLSAVPDTLIDALHIFLIGVTIQYNILEKDQIFSMMVHADREVDVSKKFYNWIDNILQMMNKKLDLKDNDPAKMELIGDLKKNYKEAIKKLTSPPSFEEVLEEIQETIEDTELHKVIGGEEEIKWEETQYSSHILIGADLLNRGFTVEGLTVTYMPRHPKGKNNADTMQQRCRFFGYKENYLESCRVFLPNESIEEFVEYVEHEESLRSDLKVLSLEEIRQNMILSDKLNPTRNNILSHNILRNKMSGWRQLRTISSENYIEENIKLIEEEIISKHKFSLFEDYGTPDRNHGYLKLGVKDVIKFISKFKIDRMPDVMRKNHTISYLNHLSNLKQIEYAYIYNMANGNPRLRSLKGENINNLFTGKSIAKGEKTYMGDESIRDDEYFCVQIHNIKIKNNYKPNHGVKVYALAFYYPQNLELSYISTTPFIQ